VYHNFENIDLHRIAEDVHSDSPVTDYRSHEREIPEILRQSPLVIIIVNCLNPSFKKKYTIKLLERYKKNLNLPHIKDESRTDRG
jgi:hypothetical protein